MINQIKTVLLLGLLTGLVLAVGQLLGGQQGLIIAFIFAMGINFFSYWFSDKIATTVYRAKPAKKQDYPRLHEMTEDICRKAGIPKPRIVIIQSANPNAFATGRNPKNSVVAVTTGILNLLTERELKGVIAHEVAHINNRDILISSIAAALAGVIAFVASMARWAAIFGGFGNRDGPNLLELLVLAIVTPIIAMMIQMAISRNREFEADKTGSGFTGEPHALADALEKLETGIHHSPLSRNSTTQATAHLMISNPFRNVSSWFSTHPPTKLRVQRLRDMS